MAMIDALLAELEHESLTTRRVLEGHCQLGADGTLLPLRGRAPSSGQQADVTASHSTNARVRSKRS